MVVYLAHGAGHSPPPFWIEAQSLPYYLMIVANGLGNSQIDTFLNSEGEKPEPSFLYTVNPPAGAPFPTKIPASDSLRRFYEICDGGYFGPMIRLIPIAELESETQRWIEILRDYDESGDVIAEGRHCVFANDADGTPWIYDAQTGEVASFYWKGGDWCDPRFAGFDDFMDDVLSPKPDDPDWSTSITATKSIRTSTIRSSATWGLTGCTSTTWPTTGS